MTKAEARPGPKNDIGYELADANLRFPDALQYAQNAVEEEEDASRKVQRSKLEVADVAHTAAISAYWDTLGWVHFRIG